MRLRRYRALAGLLLLLSMPLLMGQAPDTETSEERAIATARAQPDVAELAENPTVVPVAYYLSQDDQWKVVFTEQVSGSAVAQVFVDDDTGGVEESKISPNAYGIEYPALSEDEATKVAGASPEIREYLSNEESYTTDAEYEDGEWVVHYRTMRDGEQTEIGRVGVDDDTYVLNYVYTGDQVGWQMARGERGSYGKQANYWYVWGPMALIFALAFLRADKLFSLRNLDIAVMLSFLVSHGFFRAGDSYEAVLLWYPPLVYLLIRTLLMGFGIGERVERTSNFPTPVLFVLAGLGAALVIGLNIDARVIDVGYAGIVGGDLILSGTVPYGNMPDDVGTGDTYGPLNYLLYVPFIWAFGFTGEWGYLPAVHALTITSFVAGAAGMFFAGYRFAGLKGAAAMIFAWCVFPYTLYSSNNNTNDIIVAAVAAIGLATASLPLARGATVAAGFAIKLFPIALGPLWMLHGGGRRGPILDFVLGGAAVVLFTFWVLLLDGDPLGGAELFYEKTLAFQNARESPWSIYDKVPQVEFLQRFATAGTIFLGFVVAVYPRRRTVRRLAAFSAAIVIAFQLTVNYWFFAYVTWFEPFIFMSLLLATNPKTELDGAAGEKTQAPESATREDAGVEQRA